MFLYHWREESQHAILDELEWVRHDAGLTADERDRAVDEFIELVGAVDGILQTQAKADASYFATKCGRVVDEAEAQAIEAAFLKAYRWQYVHSGAQHPHFGKVLSSLITEKQGQRIQAGARHAAIIQMRNPNPKQRRSIMVAQAKTVEPTVVNGINVDDLFALIDDVKREPAKGKTNWRVTTTWQGQARSRAEIENYEIGGEKVPRRFSIDIDEPRELGGSNSFANPQDHLIAALNACMTVGYVAQCAVRGITLESLEIETEGEIDLRGFLGIDPAVARGYENLQLHRPHQGQRHKGAVRRSPRGCDGDLAQFLQPVAGPWPSNRPSSSNNRGRKRRAAASGCLAARFDDEARDVPSWHDADVA